jgi:hypothetical protein
VKRTAATRLLETLANERCPCGHLAQRHRKPTGELHGEVMGACRDCDCKGLLDWRDEEKAA